MLATSQVAETARLRPKAASWGHWRQFSLRSLLLFTLAASVLSAWVAHKRNEAARQQAAFRLIVAKGGASNFGPESSRPAWLRWILGADVAAVGGCTHIGNSELTDADLGTLSALRNLQVLALDGNPLTDRGLVHLTRLPKLHNLSLGETKITDAGLDTLRACRSLDWLSLDQTQTTPAAIEKLRAARPDLTIVDASGEELPPLSPAHVRGP